MLAANNTLTLAIAGGDATKSVFKDSVGKDTDKRLESALPAMGSNAQYVAAPSAYRTTACSDDHVIGDLAIPVPAEDGGTPTNSRWLVERVSMIWENGDWKWQPSGVHQPGESEVKDLTGWTTWQY